MPEINIKVQLGDLKYCNGCPCLNYNGFVGATCNMNYETFKNNSGSIEIECKDKMFIRPMTCIQENKEVVK